MHSIIPYKPKDPVEPGLLHSEAVFFVWPRPVRWGHKPIYGYLQWIKSGWHNPPKVVCSDLGVCAIYSETTVIWAQSQWSWMNAGLGTGTKAWAANAATCATYRPDPLERTDGILAVATSRPAPIWWSKDLSCKLACFDFMAGFSSQVRRHNICQGWEVMQTTNMIWSKSKLNRKTLRIMLL